MKNFRELIVWQKAHQLVLLIYKLTKVFPAEEKFNLISQIRRAATSIPTNIAEGCGKFTHKDFARYLQNAQGSSQELEYLSFLSFELDYLTQNDFNKLDSLTNEVKAMLISLGSKVRRDSKLSR